MVVGNPLMPPSRPGEKGSNLSQLQYAEKEALEIASLYGVEPTDRSASNKVRDSPANGGCQGRTHSNTWAADYI